MMRPITETLLILMVLAGTALGEAKYPLAPEFGKEKPTFAVSPGGKNVVVMGGDPYNSHIQINGRYLGGKMEVKRRVFHPEDGRYAVVYRHHDAYFLLSDGRVYGPYNDIDPVFFAEDLKEVVFVVRKDRLHPAGCISKVPRNNYMNCGDACCLFKYDFHLYPTARVPFLHVGKAYYDWDTPVGKRFKRYQYPGYGDDYVSRRKGSAPELTFLKEGKHYLRVSGRTYGPYEEAPDLLFAARNRLVFAYRSGGKLYIHQNGRSFGPADSLYSNDGIGQGHPAAAYKKDGKIYALIDGKAYGPYDGLWGMNYCRRSGRFFFVYQIKEPGQKKDYGKNYVRTNSRSFGPVSFYHSPTFSHNDYSFSFLFWKEAPELSSAEHSKIVYRQVNEKTYGPFTETGKIQFDAAGKRYIFSYTRGGLDYVQTDSATYGPFFRVYECRISYDGTRHAFTYHTRGKDYARIGSRTFGPLRQQPAFLNLTDVNYSGQPFIPLYSPLVVRAAYDLYYSGGKIEYTESPHDVIAGPEGDCGFRLFFKKSRKGLRCGVFLNDRFYGPYEEAGLSLNREGRGFLISYRLKEKEYCNVNGRVFGPYERVFEQGIVRGGYWFHYHKTGRNLMINGRSYGMLDYSYPPVFEAGGKGYAFLCKIGGDYYQQTPMRRYGPFRFDERSYEYRLYQPSLIKGRIFARFGKNGRQYILYGGKEYGPFDWGDVVRPELSFAWGKVRYAPGDELYLVTLEGGNVRVRELR